MEEGDGESGGRCGSGGEIGGMDMEEEVGWRRNRWDGHGGRGGVGEEE